MTTEMTPFEKEAIRLALAKMFQPGGWFDICTLDQCVKLARVHVPERTHTALRTLHCVHWSSMPHSMRQATAETILALFDEPPLDLPQLGASFMPPQNATKIGDGTKPATGFFKKLLGGVS